MWGNDVCASATEPDSSPSSRRDGVRQLSNADR